MEAKGQPPIFELPLPKYFDLDLGDMDIRGIHKLMAGQAGHAPERFIRSYHVEINTHVLTRKSE